MNDKQGPQEKRTIDNKEIKEIITSEKWEFQAREYVDNPEKARNLLNKALLKAEGNKEGSLGHIWDRIQLLISLVRDWLNGSYTQISKKSIILILTGLIYFVSPIDLIPDWLLALGFIDDAAVLALIINQLEKEIQKYNLWKNR